MKFLKLIAIILCISMLAVAFVGCNGGTTPETPTEPENPPVDDVPPSQEPYFERKFVSFSSYMNDRLQVKEITEHYHMAARFTIKEGFAERISVFGTIGDLTLSIYKWTKDYDTTVAGTPLKQKVYKYEDLTHFEPGGGACNFELEFDGEEIGPGNYLYVLSHVEGSTKRASVYTNMGWTSKTLPEDYSSYKINTYINGSYNGNEVVYANVVLHTPAEKPAEPALELKKDEGAVKVILLGGQSNAVGVSLVSELQKNVSPEKFAEYTNGYSNVQIMYNNCSGYYSSEFVNVKLGQGVDPNYFGPELGIAEYLAENFPNEKFYIIKYAMGGSVLETQWFNAKANAPLDLLLGLEAFAKQGIQSLKNQGLDPKIIGFVWNQGESDAIHLNQAHRYYANQEGLVNYVRYVFEADASVNGIAFFDAGIVGNLWPVYSYVNIQKYQYSVTSPLNFYIETTDYPEINTLKENADMAHYDCLAMIKLGHLYGAEIAKVIK